MHDGFYCGQGDDFYMPREHRLEDYCYDGSHELKCEKCRVARPRRTRLTLVR